MATASSDPGLHHTTSSHPGPLATAEQAAAAEDVEPPIGLAGSSSSIKAFDEEGNHHQQHHQPGEAHTDVGVEKSSRGFLIDKVRLRRPTSVELSLATAA